MSLTPGRKRKCLTTQELMKQKRRSIRTQHSISLHIPIDELSSTNCGLNCYIDLPQQVFSLTYLECNETNPESLAALDCLKNGKWQIYRVGHLYGMDYKKKTLTELKKAIDNELKINRKREGPDVEFHSAVTVIDNLSPTENDNQALQITISKQTDERQLNVYTAFIMSWCNPVQQKDTFLPLMLCRGANNVRTIVNSVLQDRHAVTITKLLLPQDDFYRLITYCTIMLDENDDYEVTTTYKIPPGTIKLTLTTASLLKVWKRIHQDDSNEIDLDDILRFQHVMEKFYESAYGVKLDRAHFDEFIIRHCCSITIKGLVWFRSTKTIHVVLKFLNYIIVEQLKLKALNYRGDANKTTMK